MSEADKTRLGEVLRRPDVRKLDGTIDRALVSKLTGLSYGCVDRYLARNSYLHAHQPEADTEKMVPTEAQSIDAPAAVAPAVPGVTMSQEDFDRAQAILRQQKRMLAKDWKGLGMDDAMATRMENLSRVGTAPLLPVMNMLYGGLIKHVASLDEVLERDAQRIKDNMLPAELDNEGAPAEDGKVQREWRYCWYAGYKLHLELFNSMQKTQAMLARVMREMKDMGLGERPAEKGVFQAQARVSDRQPDDAST